MLRNRKKVLFVVEPPPRNATEQQWQEYEKRNQNWMIKYFLTIYLTMGTIVGLAYLLHISIFTEL